MLTINWEFTYWNQDGSILVVQKIESTFLLSESGGLLLIFDGLMCESVYISHLTFFSLGADSRRQWKCRVGATDRHAIALWPHSFTSRQTGRVKTGPSLIWRNAVSACVTWAPGENAVWMTDISLLSASINHNSKNSLLASVLLFLYIFHSKSCWLTGIKWIEQWFKKTIKQGKEIRLPLAFYSAPEIAWWFWQDD